MGCQWPKRDPRPQRSLTERRKGFTGIAARGSGVGGVSCEPGDLNTPGLPRAPDLTQQKRSSGLAGRMQEGLARWLPGWPWGPGSSRAVTVTGPTGQRAQRALCTVQPQPGVLRQRVPVRWCCTVYNGPLCLCPVCTLHDSPERSEAKLTRAGLAGTALVLPLMPCAGPLPLSADGRFASRPPVCQLSARSEAESPGRPGRC